ncbi:DNA-directed RNA polymerase subunit H [Candidatus Woesearchaeota archaeon]|nr:DNA-directed RNA polymerase subunit H [Candidatus Woesearchaeota archaeon]
MARRKKKRINIQKHILMPKHIKISEKEKKELLEMYKITIKELPKIRIDDPAIQSLKPKIDDVIKIMRKSSTAGESIFYRRVISE